MPSNKDSMTPTELPPAIRDLVESTVAQQGPSMALSELTAMQTATVAAAPTVAPPAEAAAEEAAEGIAAWHTGVKITALWVNAAQRNAWAAVEGLGWRRITPDNDSAFQNIAAMLSHAKQMGSSCNVQVGSDNLIHEVYVW